MKRVTRDERRGVPPPPRLRGPKPGPLRRAETRGGALALLLLAGCGAIRTPGTEDLTREALAEIHVPRHTGAIAGDHGEAHLDSITLTMEGDTRPFERRPSYEIRGSGETFLVLPGTHSVSLRYDTCRHWPAAWFQPFGRLFVAAPFGSADLNAQAGRRYRLRCAVEGWNSGPRHRHWFEESP